MCLSRVVDEHEAAGRVAYSYRTTPIAVDTGKDYRAQRTDGIEDGTVRRAPEGPIK